MNNSTTFTSYHLDQINDEMAINVLPVILLICIYMFVGLFGNLLVAYYYGCFVKPSPSYYFIVAMAIYDIILCCVSMPLEIVDLRFSYNFPSVIACKVLRFVNYFSSTASGLVLITVAVDRYRKVCQSFKNQITMTTAKIIIGVLCFASVCIAWPALVIYDINVVNISSAPGLNGYDCTTIRNKEYKVYISIYNGVCFLIFIGCITTLIVLYILIGKKLYHLKKFRFSATARKSANVNYTPPTSESEIDANFRRFKPVVYAKQPKSTFIPLLQIKETNSLSDSTAQQSNKKINAIKSTSIENKVHETSQSKESVTPLYYKNEISSLTNQEPKWLYTSDLSDSDSDTSGMKLKKKRSILHRRKKIREQYIHLRKYTLLMLSVSMAFILSFLPYLGLMTWRTLAVKYEREILSKVELILFNIFLRSWMLSSVVNPIIYGFFNADFSTFVCGRLKRILCSQCVKQADVDNETKIESSHTF